MTYPNHHGDKKTYAEQIKGKTGIKRLINAAGYSIDGFKSVYKEAAFRQLVVLHSVLIILAFVFFSSRNIQLVLILASFMSLIVEIINTAIEAAVDHTSLDYSPLAKCAKDAGSAAQFLALAMCGVLWFVAIIL